MRVLYFLGVLSFLAKPAVSQPPLPKYTNSRFNFFDVELLRNTLENKRGNVLVSPASVKSTLLMLLDGCMGETAKEIHNALRLPADRYELREQLYKFRKALQSNTTLQNANGLFLSRKLRLRKEYELNILRDYSAEITRLDFLDPNAAALAINGWVSQKTRGLIPTIVDPAQVPPTTELFVANALYFKSTWYHAFNPLLTRSGCFHREGKCINAAMMDLQAELKHAFVEDLRAHALELPYEGNLYSMILLVPGDRDGLDNLVRDLSFVPLHHIFDLMHPTDVSLLLPKFVVNYNEDLISVLRSLHISSLFSPKANLSGILEGEASSVNSFQHKVFMSVDEAGTVAAAVTSAMIVPLMYQGVQVNADRPFLFYIVDNREGVVMFEGRIEEPNPYVDPSPIPVYPGQFQNRGSFVNQNPPPFVTNTNANKKSGGFVDSLKKIFG